MGVITFNGRSSEEFGVIVELRPDHSRGSRRGEMIEVPGRNGSLVIEDGSYTTYTQAYSVSFKEGVATPPYKRAAQVAEWLLGSKGFCRLEDSFEPGYFRLARFAGPLNISQVAGAYGKCVLEFECQPERYLISGESSYSMNVSYDSGINLGTIRIEPIPADAVSFCMESNVGLAVANYRTSGGSEIGAAIYDTPVPVPDGAAKVTCGWNGADEDSYIILYSVDADGVRTPVCGICGVYPTVYNPTSRDASPLLKFTDTSTVPSPVAQTLTHVDHTYISRTGEVVKAVWSSQEGLYTTEEVSVTGYATAIITGGSYSFFDANGDSIQCGFDAMAETRIPIPSGAQTIVIGGDPSTTAALSLQEAIPDPGTAAATINGVTVNLDFSEHDTIYLDCGHHDAYYADKSNANAAVSFSDPTTNYPTFPVLPPGDNIIKVGDGHNLQFSISPRWWAL